MDRVAKVVLEAVWIMEMGLVLAQLTNYCLKWQGSCSARSVNKNVAIVQTAEMLVMGVLPHSSMMSIPKSVVVLRGCTNKPINVLSAWRSASDARME